jgi:ATP-dependent DNA helicase PIF1
MTQDQALDILKTGANVFLTGEPGAGKTFTINKYIAYLRTQDIEPAITASTGIAATHIGGMTIHSFSGIGIKSFLNKYDLDKIATSEYLNRRISKTKVLIIDEVSMLHANTLAMVDAVCREIKQSSDPFGGIQVVLVGDFFQLPPIEKSTNENPNQTLISEKPKRFAYESDAWRRLNPITCYISEQHRQDDTDFLELLLAIRRNKVTEMHHAHLKSRHIEADDFPEDITKLFSHNFDVDRVNDVELGKIEEDTRRYEMESTGTASLVAALEKGCLSPKILTLKKGAIVMCTKNNPKEHYVNGTLGTVVEFDEFTNNPIIKLKNGRSIEISPMDWVVEENGKIKAQITQVPLRLAWAITVHKSQGMSMDGAVMDLSQVFEYGQGYVALSRVRNLAGLYLLGLNQQALQVHPDILKQDDLFRESSDQAEKLFGNLGVIEIKKMHKNFIVALGGKWKEGNTVPKPASPVAPGKLEQIRTTHKNAYKKWSPEEEQELIKLFQSGKSVKEIASHSGRQVGGIRSRLIKLGLIEEK